jgi:hypothetical protein
MLNARELLTSHPSPAWQQSRIDYCTGIIEENSQDAIAGKGKAVEKQTRLF